MGGRNEEKIRGRREDGREEEGIRKGREDHGALKWLSLDAAASRRHGRRCRAPLPRKGDKLQVNRLQRYSLKGAGGIWWSKHFPSQQRPAVPRREWQCVHICVFLWVCMCACAVCVHKCQTICGHVCICVSTCAYTHVCVHMHMHMYCEWVSVSNYVRIVCTCVNMHVHGCLCTRV